MTKYNLEHKGVTCTAADWEADPHKFVFLYKGCPYVFEQKRYISQSADTDHIRCAIEQFLEDVEDKDVLTQAHILAHYEAIYALADMVCQFGYSTTFRNQKAVCNGGLSALEVAFSALQDCGCRLNSNGTITLKNLFEFQEKFDKLRRGENYGKSD